jgi:hypothetical protein
MTNKQGPTQNDTRAATGRPPGQDDVCDASCEPTSGPVREGGGTTGAGNLSPGQASRTGGATSGVNPDQVATPPQRREVPPGA